MTIEIPFADVDILTEAYGGSWYFIAGAGGDPQEWVTGYHEWMEQNGCGIPERWFHTNGGTVNSFAQRKKGRIAPNDLFQGDLTCLLFPLAGLDIGKLAIFKLGMQDRWFDDVVDNMRSVS